MNAPQQQSIIQQVRNLHGFLHTRKGNMEPEPQLNAAFTQLVDMAHTSATAPVANTILAELGADNTLGSLHTLCAEGEFALEMHWANKLRASASPLKLLRTFPYWNNYLKLAKLEVNAIRSVQPDAKKILFIGAGPLPLTAYIFAAHYGLEVTNIEAEEDAKDCAVEWMNPLLGDRAIPCHHTDVLDFTDFSGFDVVVMAALVGLNKAEKHKIITHIHAHMQPHQLLMVRSVRGLRSLLYPVVKATDLVGFNTVKEVHPRGEVVNSVVLARKQA